MNDWIGADGWPMGSRVANRPDDELARRRRAFIDRELEQCRRAWSAGVRVALADAVALCERMHEPPPKWVAEGVLAVVSGTAPSSGVGRASHASDLVDFTRWDAVVECRERKNEDGMPVTWDETYKAVSNLLRGTLAQGSPDAIKRAYQRVQQRMSSGAARYYLPSIRGHK